MTQAYQFFFNSGIHDFNIVFIYFLLHYIFSVTREEEFYEARNFIISRS